MKFEINNCLIKLKRLKKINLLKKILLKNGPFSPIK